MAVKTNKITATDVRQLLVPADPDGAMITIVNSGSENSFLGDVTVTPGTGFLLNAQTGIVTMQLGPLEAIYVICGAGKTTVVSYLSTMSG